MNQATTQPTKSVFGPLTPAVPTDTCAVLNRLLTLSEQVRQKSMSSRPSIVDPNVMTMLLRVMKVRDPSIILHGQRIATICRGVSELLGWNDSERAQLEIAALLHDLGKIGIPDHILRKPGKLSSEEYDFVSLYQHAANGLLQALYVDSSLVQTLSHVHQNSDGIAVDSAPGELELPLGPRILSVADAYDSLCSPKSYRRGMTHEEVIKILTEQSGGKFDGNIVRTVDRWYEDAGHGLFRLTDPLGESVVSSEMSDEERNEVVVISQILTTLYQFESLYDGFFLLDANMNYTIWSSGMESLSGLSMEKTIGRGWNPADIRLAPISQTGGSTEPEEEIISQVLRNGRPQFATRVCELGDQQQFSVDVYTLPITEGSSKVSGVVQLFRRKGAARRQSREYVELKLAATRDALTGVANRGQLETTLRHLLEDYHNHEGARHLSVIFLDVDKFKKINDTHGHNAGDQVLVDMTRLLQHETYSGEVIGRYGGEEFVVMCPDTDMEATVRRAERLRLAIEKSSVGGVSGLSVTSSFGVATAHVGDTVQTVLERADECLYRAKQTGRNKTCWETQDGVEDDQMQTMPEESESRVTDVNGVLLFNQHIEMSTSLELTAMKLNAFIAATPDIKVTHQEHGHMKFRVGTVGFRRRWGRTPDRQAIEMDVRFETSRESTDNGKAKTRRRISVAIVPVGKVPDNATFELRCLQLMLQMRAYLLGT